MGIAHLLKNKGANEPKKWALTKPKDKARGEWPAPLLKVAQNLVAAIKRAEAGGKGEGKQRQCD